MSGFAGFFAPLDNRSPVTVFDGPFHDPAEVLALYRQHGPACVEHLRGPFTLAIWDPRDGGTGLLARDPTGLRSLYYFHETGTGRLTFATGVRALMADGAVPRQLDARGLYGFFRHGAVAEPCSMVAGVRALETGARLLWRAGRITLEHPRPAPGPAPARSLRETLLESVAAHLADGAPRAVFAGGGIGSAALLALARETGHEKNLRVLTLEFDAAPDGETDLARRIAGHFGVPHTVLRLDRQRARAWFDDYLPALDQPDVPGFPWFVLGRFAQEEGIASALAGIGLNERLGDPVLHAALHQLMTSHPRNGLLRSLVGRIKPPPPMQADFFTRAPTLPGAYAAVRGIHTAEEARAMVARFTDPTGCADPLPEDAAVAGDNGINALERRRRLRDQLLRAVETSGRAHGLDWRLPFVDAQIPAANRPREGRNLLRAAVPEIPAWVGVDGGSGGPRFPYEEWRADEWGAAKPADAAGARRTRRTWEQKWGLFLFRRWWRQVSNG